MELTAIHVYPIKGCAGVRPARWDVDVLGPRLDRRWMVVDPSGAFVTAREAPRLVKVAAEARRDRLVIHVPGAPPHDLPLRPSTSAARTLRVQVWGEEVQAVPASDAASAALSAWLEREVVLVALPEGVARAVDPTRARPTDRVGFADGFPFLVVSRASLDDLNARLRTPVTMERFRPNLVIGGARPFEEDTWSVIRVGTLVLRLLKPCARCSVVCVDPETGARGKQPLATLATYRQVPEGVMFGQNAVHDGPGTLELGQPVEVLERRR